MMATFQLVAQVYSLPISGEVFRRLAAAQAGGLIPIKL